MSQMTSTTMPAAPGPSLIPQAPSAPARPEYIPEKFWDASKGAPKVDELAKAYSSLEKKLGDRWPPDPKDAPQQPSPQPDASPQVPAGLDIAALTNEFSAKGSLSEETIKSLEAKGIPKPLVDSYIKGIQAQSQIVLNDVFSNKEELTQFKEWAGKSLSPEEQTAFNTLVQTGDSNAIRLALQGLKVKFAESSPKEPELLGGEASSSPGSVFKSWAHVTAAMNDKRYHTDPAYRESVEQRVKVSVETGSLQ